MSNYAKLKDMLEQAQNEQKEKLKKENRKFIKLIKWIWFFISFGFIWTFKQLTDWRNAIIFGVVCVIVSCEVWIPILMFFFTQNRHWLELAGLGMIFWNVVPCTPYLLICLFTTLFIARPMIDKVKAKELSVFHLIEIIIIVMVGIYALTMGIARLF